MSRSRFPFPFLVALGLFAATGCVEERAFYILQHQLPAVQNGVCVSSPSEGVFLPEGTLDVSAGQGYWMFPLLKFDILTSGDRWRRGDVTGGKRSTCGRPLSGLRPTRIVANCRSRPSVAAHSTR